MKQLPPQTCTRNILDALSDFEAVTPLHHTHTVERRGGGHWAALLTPGFLDRGRPRQEGHCHLRPGSPSPGLAQDPAAVSATTFCALAHSLIDCSLTRELEKKFSDRHVLLVASRRILPRPKRSNRSRSNQTQKRPRSRTLTAVHDNILTDLVYPVEIVGKRLRTKEDGSKLLTRRSVAVLTTGSTPTPRSTSASLARP